MVEALDAEPVGYVKTYTEIVYWCDICGLATVAILGTEPKSICEHDLEKIGWFQYPEDCLEEAGGAK